MRTNVQWKSEYVYPLILKLRRWLARGLARE